MKPKILGGGTSAWSKPCLMRSTKVWLPIPEKLRAKDAVATQRERRRMKKTKQDQDWKEEETFMTKPVSLPMSTIYTEFPSGNAITSRVKPWGNKLLEFRNANGVTDPAMVASLIVFIKNLLSQARKEAREKALQDAAHITKEGYCCACDYDIAVMNKKIAKARQEGQTAGWNECLEKHHDDEVERDKVWEKIIKNVQEKAEAKGRKEARQDRKWLIEVCEEQAVVSEAKGAEKERERIKKLLPTHKGGILTRNEVKNLIDYETNN